MKLPFKITDKHMLLLVGLVAVVSAIGIATGQTAPNPGHTLSELSPGAFPSGNYVFPNDLAAGGTLFVDSSTGMVGIGTESPSQKLTVNGNISANNLVFNMTRTCQWTDWCDANNEIQDCSQFGQNYVTTGIQEWEADNRLVGVKLKCCLLELG